MGNTSTPESQKIICTLLPPPLNVKTQNPNKCEGHFVTDINPVHSYNSRALGQLDFAWIMRNPMLSWQVFPGRRLQVMRHCGPCVFIFPFAVLVSNCPSR